MTIGATLLMCFFSMHSSYVSSLAYSSPSIVIEAGRTQTGQRILYDDYREVGMCLRFLCGIVLMSRFQAPDVFFLVSSSSSFCAFALVLNWLVLFCFLLCFLCLLARACVCHHAGRLTSHSLP